MPVPHPVPPFLREAIGYRARCCRACTVAFERKTAARPGPELVEAQAAWGRASALYTAAVAAEKAAQRRAREERRNLPLTLHTRKGRQVFT